MRVFLRSTVHAALTGGDCVLLDTSGDRYLCVPEGAQRLRPSPDRSALEGPAGLLREALPESLLSPTRCPRPSPPPLPTANLPDDGAARASWSDIWRLVLSYLDYLAGFRGRSFEAILRNAREGGRPGLGVAAARQAQVFQQLVVWLPVSGQCLVRSFLLLRFLIRSGCDARWVFGVRTWPFAAHCWIQEGDTVLDDHADRLVGYVPILVV